MKKYEYLSTPCTILSPKNIDELNRLGANGWELVLLEPESHSAVFKRKMEDKDKDKEKSCKNCKFRLAYMEQKAEEKAQMEKQDKENI